MPLLRTSASPRPCNVDQAHTQVVTSNHWECGIRPAIQGWFASLPPAGSLLLGNAGYMLGALCQDMHAQIHKAVPLIAVLPQGPCLPSPEFSFHTTQKNMPNSLQCDA